MRPDATTEEIRAAYRRLARRHHPDTGGGRADAMAEVNAAWAVLRDPGRRTRYDAELRDGASRATPTTEPDGLDDGRLDDGGQFGEDGFVPVGPLHPGRWGIPAIWLAVLAALGLIFVFTAYAATSGSGSEPRTVDGLLRPGSCVDLAPDGFAVEVPCGGPHDGRVELLPPFDSPCPAGSEAYADRNAMGKVCVRRR